MNAILVICGVLALTEALTDDEVDLEKWTSYKNQHNLQFSQDDDLEHYIIFSENIRKIETHNQLYERNLTTYRQRIYSHAHNSDGSDNVGGSATIEDARMVFEEDCRDHAVYVPPAENPPDEKDWRESGAVVRIKDQGSCGACAIFATVAVAESHYYLKYNRLVSLSEQNLIDCSQTYGNYGCGGSTSLNSYKYMMDYGITSEEAYPFEMETQTCRRAEKPIVARVSNYSFVPFMNEEALKAVIANVGPVVSCIHMSNSLSIYDSGVYYDTSCSNFRCDHLVAIVGYGSDPKDGDYWLVKNSWGEDWGEHGYVRIARNRNSTCSVASFCHFPLIA